ncbi:hypothetical protein GCM10020000_46220 [Streptomyces olivoverticillatus]
MHVDDGAGLLAGGEEGVPVAGVDAGEAEVGGELAEGHRAYAAFGIAVYFRDGEAHVPQGYEAQRDQLRPRLSPHHSSTIQSL